MSASLRVDRVVTSGTFSLDGGTWEVDNNVWVIGDEHQCVVVDAAHEARPILDAVADRRVVAILLTHAHDDHIGAVNELRDATGSPALLHPDDRVLWDRVHTAAPDHDLADDERIDVAGTQVQVLHTPGHTPGACCFYVPEIAAVFTGDTLFDGGPGATGRSFSDFPTIVESITTKLLSLPSETTVYTGHGADTTIGAEAPDVQVWLDRGY